MRVQLCVCVRSRARAMRCISPALRSDPYLRGHVLVQVLLAVSYDIIYRNAS